MKPAPPVISTRFFRISARLPVGRRQQRQKSYSRVVSSTDGPAAGRRERRNQRETADRAPWRTVHNLKVSGPGRGGCGCDRPRLCPKRGLAVLPGCAKSVPGDPNDPFRPARAAPLSGRRLLEHARATTSRRPLGIDRNPRLTQVTSCGQLETAIEDTLVLQMKSTLEQIRKSDFYIGVGGGPVPGGRPGHRHPGRSRQRAHQRQHHQHPGRRGGRGGLRPERRHAHRGARRRQAPPALVLAARGDGRDGEPADRRLAPGHVPRAATRWWSSATSTSRAPSRAAIRSAPRRPGRRWASRRSAATGRTTSPRSPRST